MNNKREFVEKFNSVSARKLMYKMEAITINKLIIVSSVVIGFMALGVLGVYIMGQDIFGLYRNLDINVVYNNLMSAVSQSKNYYIVILLFIIILDILGMTLGRKKDTKTSLIKLCTTLIMIITTILKGTYSICVLDIFLVLTLILNIGNIYYNRDEKIKLLKAEN